MLQDLVAEGVQVLFVGFNPSPRSVQQGHHYAGRGNQFWRLRASRPGRCGPRKTTCCTAGAWDPPTWWRARPSAPPN
ncbi:hypothetical protein [Deinococcus sp. YIM 77859]|uniref:uracil-DNA glycosylase family protein n=1 Tax=Deinococcus sp. YIM 77859 TaxID=1540221 RepID=UPI000A68BA50|nr:hypothetical protein [Deinococcus sp. YIM 77859]